MTSLQCIPPADIRLLCLRHCSPCTQQEAKPAQTRAVPLADDATDLTVNNLCCLLPPERARHSLTSRPSCWFEAPSPSSQPLNFLGKSSSPTSGFSEAQYTLGQGELTSRGQYQGQVVGYSRRWKQIQHLPDNCAPPSAFSFYVTEVIPEILYRVQLHKASVGYKPVHNTVSIVKQIKTNKQKNSPGFWIRILALPLGSCVTLGKSFILHGPHFSHL